MTEPKQASMLNLFSASAPKVSKGAASFGAVDSAQPLDGTFSRELVRANERSASSSRGRDSSSRDAHESSADKSSKRVEPQRSSASEKSSRSDTPSAKASDKPSNSSTGKPDSASGGEDVAKLNTDPVKGEEAARANEDEQMHSGSKPVSTASESESATEVTTADLATSLIPTTPVQITQPDAEAASVEVDDSLSTGAVPTLDNSQGDKEEATSSHLVDAQKAAAAQLTGSVAIEGQTSARPSGAGVVDGDQLSPVQLANRQAHLLASPFGRDNKAVQTTAQPLVDESVDGEVSLAATRPVLAAGATSTGMGTQMKGLSPAAEQANGGATVAEVTNKTGMPGEGNVANVNQRLQHAELAAAAEADARRVAHKAKQEITQENLTQARQIAQQQLQNAIPLSPTVSAVTADSGNQSPDNMFLAVQGGIVTAPVLQRAEAGNPQSINAPINMPILQDDADKAMSGNIRWMVNEGVKNAVVNVTPSGMGPISVSIGMEKDQMSLSIVAMQGSTREALDAMLPRLREQLAAQGHENVKVDISDGRPEQSDRGYGQQYSGEQTESERGEHAMGTQVADEESGASQDSETSEAAEAVQAQIMVGNDGKIRRSYDVYV